MSVPHNIGQRLLHDTVYCRFQHRAGNRSPSKPTALNWRDDSISIADRFSHIDTVLHQSQMIEAGRPQVHRSRWRLSSMPLVISSTRRADRLVEDQLAAARAGPI